jgi:hypothetical protein
MAVSATATNITEATGAARSGIAEQLCIVSFQRLLATIYHRS